MGQMTSVPGKGKRLQFPQQLKMLMAKKSFDKGLEKDV
jgi:hypothetical protein